MIPPQASPRRLPDDADDTGPQPEPEAQPAGGRQSFALNPASVCDAGAKLWKGHVEDGSYRRAVWERERTKQRFHYATRLQRPSTATSRAISLRTTHATPVLHAIWMACHMSASCGRCGSSVPTVAGLYLFAAKSPVFNRISMSVSDEFASGALPVATATHVRAGLLELGAVSSSQFLTARHSPVALSRIWPGFPSRLSTSNCCKVLTRLHF